VAAGPQTLGFFYFAAVKLAGYTAAASFLKRQYPESKVNPWFAGGVRTLIGIVVGVAAVFLGEKMGLFRSTPEFFVFLVPVRILEWLLLLYIFFERPVLNLGRSLKWSSIGVAWSFTLDIPAVLAVFLIPGGAWIC